MRWFRPRPQRLVLQTVQMRVTLADPDTETTERETLAPDRTPLVPDAPTVVPMVPTVSAAPPLAVRPVEDAEWTFRN